MAVRVRFELTEPVKVQRFSRPPHSTTLPPHHGRLFSYLIRPAVAYHRTLVLFKDAFLTRTLAYLLLIFALCTMLVTVRIVLQTHNPALFGDQWVIVDDLQQTNGEITWQKLWVQHNEHRIPLARLASYADLLLFGGRNVFLLIAIFFIQLTHLAILLAVLRKFGPVDLAFGIPAAALCVVCLFSPLQIENLTWGFQLQFVLVICAASLSFAFAVTQSPPFAGLILAGWLAELSLSNGVLVWPVLSLVAFGLEYPRKKQIWLGAIGAASVAVYFFDYQTPSYHSDPLESLQHPIAILKFVLTYFRTTFDTASPIAAIWPTIAESITLIALVWALIGAFRCFVLRRPGFSRLEYFCYATQVFLLASAFVTALGQLRFGAEQAMSSRYQSLALLFWASSGILVLLWAYKAETQRLLLSCEAVLLILFLAQPPRFAAAEAFAQNRKAISVKAYSALVRNTNDREAILADFPSVESVLHWYSYLQSHHLGPDPVEFGGAATPANGRLPTIRPATDAPLLNGYHIAPAEACWGFIDEGVPVEGSPHVFTIFGWAWQKAGARPPDKILLAFPDGAVAQTAEQGIPRPDVLKASPEITNPNTGWQARVQAGSGVHLRAYAILGDNKTACPLSNEFIAP